MLVELEERPGKRKSYILEIVLDMTAHEECLSEEMTGRLESGVIFICPTSNTDQKFNFVMLVRNFLSVISELRPRESCMLKPESTAAVLLFDDLVSRHVGLSCWWERTVALSLVCRSLSSACGDEAVATFGFLLPWTSTCPPLSARIASAVVDLWQRGMDGKLQFNELVVSPDKSEGFDFVVKI